MKKADLLLRAANDMWAVDLMWGSRPFSDEFQYDLVAYHLQQCLEQTMKFE